MTAATGALAGRIAGSSDDAYTIVRLVGFGFSLLAVLAVGARAVAVRVADPYLLALFAWCALSLVWTESLPDSGRSLVGLFGALALGAALSLAMPPAMSLRALAGVTALLAAASLVVGLLAPSVGTIQVVRPDVGMTDLKVGLFASNSDLGVVAGIAAIISIGLVLTGAHKVWALAAAGVAAALLWSNSITMVVATAIAVGVILSLRLSRLIVAGAAVALVVAALSPISSVLLDLAGRSRDLTGRTGIWNETLRLIGETPVLGRGLGAGGRHLTSDTGIPLLHAHNGYLQVTLDLGVVGALIVAVLLVRTAVGLAAMRVEPATFVPSLGLFAFFLVANLANTYILTAHALTALFFWLYLGARSASHVGRDSRRPA